MKPPRTPNAVNGHGKRLQTHWRLFIQARLPEAYLAEIQEEAARLDRSQSWVVQQAWEIAKDELRSMPGAAEQIERARFLARRSR